MDYVNTVLVGNEEYIITTCSASKQWEMLEIFFKYGLTDALYQIATGNNDLVAASMFGQFSKEATPQEKAQVTEMLLGNCIKKGEEKPVSIDDFHSRMFTFICLHIEALKINYADFLPFLQSAEEEETTTTETADKMSPL